MTKPTKYLTQTCIEAIRDHIREAGGREVYFVGNTNNQKIVEEVNVVARGNENSVPAIMQAAKYGDVVLHNHPSGLLEPSAPDVAVASQMGNDGVGFFIVNNDVTEIYAVVEPFDRESTSKLDTEIIEALLASEGLISQKLPGFEFRQEQMEMVRTICQAFNQDKIAIVEAGTGVGKTMAYLLPAIFWAVQNKERCVISTNTINLQEQLIKKDIPFLKSIFNFKFKAVLVKGRRNYACLRKVDEVHTDLDMFAEDREREELINLVEWARKSKDGSKADLTFIPMLSVWDKIAADSETCTRTKCPHYQACFVLRARREAIQADILIVNHHLLFADIAVRQAGGQVAVLPAYQRLILDEAHHVEDVATSYFGAGITKIGINRMIGQLHRTVKGKNKGQFHVLAAKLNKTSLPNYQIMQLQQFIENDLIPAADELDMRTNATMDGIFAFTKQVTKEDMNNESKLRLTLMHRNHPDWKLFVQDYADDLISAIRLFSKQVSKLLKQLENIQNEKDKESLLSVRVEIMAQVMRLEEAANTIQLVLFQSSEDVIRWIEAQDRYNNRIVRLRSSPLEVAETLKDSVYDQFKTVIMTSATLTVKGLPNRDQFDYLENRIGLSLVNSTRRIEKILPAPFDYRKQSILIIPRDIPEPNQKSFSTVLKDLIFRALLVSKGRAFVLFTSYGLLNMLFNQLEEPLREKGIPIFKQGSENRHRLLERFRQNRNSALFATDSFWEGVDVQGKALESVIITKLPFKVPTEPVIEARVEAIKKQGGNAFMEYTVPQATIKFKQGFGRLIRSKTDRGCVIIFDKRVIEKDYGKVFLQSLPDSRLITGTKEAVFKQLEAFFQQTIGD